MKKKFTDELKKEALKEIKKDIKKKDSPAALFIPAGALLGLGIGFMIANVPGGLFLGLGTGFLLFALTEIYFYLKK